MAPPSSSNYLAIMTKVLYVEDEPFLAKIVMETLTSKGYDVTLVTDGSEATPTFQSGVFDICVLDIMLPNKNGFEIAEEIRSTNKEIPILFLTAKDQTTDVLKGFESGGNDYIRKPFSMEELMVRIDNFVKLANIRASSKQAEKISIGKQYIFSPHELTLTHPEASLSLSHRECQILHLLSDNMGSVTERKEILLKVWGDDSFYNSRNLDVYITKLRGYFKEEPAIKIKTLKGVGYQFIVTAE